GIISQRGSDAHDYGIHEGAQAVEMIEPFGAVDVVGMSGCSRSAPIERLPDLANHKQVIDLPRPQGPKNPVPPGRAIALAGPDRRHGVAPMQVLSTSGDGIDHTHRLLKEWVQAS